ncbi:MAG: hypothetical protein H6725_15630 [Sandaracinaceae bacterium]|nr:hypothetical protein [Sandaracinaceae bacterium]
MSNTPCALLRGEVRVPLARIRRALRSAPADLELLPSGERLRVQGTVTALGAPVTFSTDVELAGLEARGRARLLTLRFYDTRAQVPDDAPGPLAKTLRAGQLDLTRVGDRVAAQLGLPAFIVSAKGNAITLDLLQLPWLLAPERALLTRGLVVGTRALTVRRIRVVADSIALQLSALPGGLRGLTQTAVAELVLPGLSRWATGDGA